MPSCTGVRRRPRAAASPVRSAGARPRCRPAERTRPARARCRRRCSGPPGERAPRPTRSRRPAPGAAQAEATRPSASRAAEAVRSRRAVFIALPFAGPDACSYPCTGLCCATLCVVLAPSARSRGARWRSASPLHWCGTGCGCARRWCRRSRGRRPPRSLSQPRAPRCETRGSTRSRCGPTSPTSTCPTTTRRRSCARVQVRLPDRDRPGARTRHPAHDPAAARAGQGGAAWGRSSTGSRRSTGAGSSSRTGPAPTSCFATGATSSARPS